MDYIKIAKNVLDIEAKALAQLKENIDDNFSKAVEILLKAPGKVVVTGMGKSGHIGTKIAASFASTGTSSFFVHPSEAFHGDLGMITKEDSVLAIANSGETDEILRLLPYLIDNNIDIVSITSNPDSTLARNSSVHLNIGPLTEACPLRLAPTTSTTLTLALGDALTVALMEGRGFKEEHYAQYHPGGSLGKRLLSKVGDFMSPEGVPVVAKDASMTDCIYKINNGRIGLCVVGRQDNVAGIITDGDLRRAMEQHQKQFFDLNPAEIMTTTPVFIASTERLDTAQKLMVDRKITSLLVGSSNNLKGVIQLHDIKI